MLVKKIKVQALMWVWKLNCQMLSGDVWPAGMFFSHRQLATSCGGRGAMHADTIARCMVFPPTHWCCWLPGSACNVSWSSAAWLGCVSEDARLSTFPSPESLQELPRWAKIATTYWIPQNWGKNYKCKWVQIFSTWFSFLPSVWCLMKTTLLDHNGRSEPSAVQIR